MGLLTLLGLGVAMSAISNMANKSCKKAYPNMVDKQVQENFNAESARFGIKGKTGDFTDERINMIAAYNNVTPDKYGVLPEDGWRKCIPYVERYSNDVKDQLDFENAWHTTIAHQLEAKRKIISDPSNRALKHYESHNAYFSNPENKSDWQEKTIVLEIEHWHGIPHDQQIKRMEELQRETYWGHLCKETPILRENPRLPKTYIETWILYAAKEHVQGSKYTENVFRRWYKECCTKLGYDHGL